MKRFLLRCGMFVALGATINLAVAWIGNLEWAQIGSGRGLYAGKHGGLFTASDEWIEFEQSGSLLFTELTWSAGLPDRDLDKFRKTRMGAPPWWSIVPSLPGYQRPDVEGHRPLQLLTEIGSGFPMRSMYWCGHGVHSNISPFTSVIPLKERTFTYSVMRSTISRTIPRVLPLHVVWPGFAINTIFYAAILWLLFAAPGFVKRRIRARRGQCPACAYPVGSSEVCTECGRPVKKWQ